jgi:Flp pilus assembly protein TadD
VRNASEEQIRCRAAIPAAAVFATAFLVYFYTLCPTVYWDDAGELISACYTLGIPHPPGHPLYAILGKLFTLIPIGSPAYRVNMMSAFFGALTSVMLFHVVRELIIEDEKLARFAVFGGVVAALAIAFSRILWDQAVVAETTTLHSFFMMTVTWLAFRIDAGGPDDRRLTRRLLLFSFIYGLSFTNHVAGLFFAPSLAVILFWRLRFRLFRPGRLVFMMLLFGVALAMYAYLPIASRANPPVDWGDPETLKNFLWVVTARQYSSDLLRVPTLVGVLYGFRNLIGTFVSDLSVLGCGFALLGAWRLWKTRKQVVVYGLIVIGILFVTSLNSAFIFVYLLPAVLMAAFWAGVGVAVLCTAADRLARASNNILSRRAVHIAYCIAAALVPVLFVMHFPENNKRHYVYAEEFGRTVLSSLPDNAILFTGSANPLFIGWYLQYCEGYRTDVTLISRNALVRPGYMDAVRRQHPEMVIPTEFQYAEDEADALRYEGRVGGREIPPLVNAYYVQLCKLNADRFPIFWEGVEKDQVLLGHLVPHYPVFRLSLKTEDFDRRDDARENDGIPSADALVRRFKGDPAAGLAYGNSMFNYASYYQMRGDPVSARHYCEEALKLCQTDTRALNSLGIILSDQGESAKAHEMFLKAYCSRVNDPISNHNVGQSYMERGQFREAIPFFRRAAALDPTKYENYHNLGLCYGSIGKNRRALKAFEKALELRPDSPETLTSVGVTYLRLNETKSAEKFLRAALELEPDDAENWYNLACLQAMEKNVAASSASLLQAITIDKTRIYELASKDSRMFPILESLGQSE